MNNEHVTLVNAYHAIYDIKDAARHENVRYLAYETLQKLSALMVEMGMDAPKRYDGDGRPTVAPRAPLAIDPPDEDYDDIGHWTVSGDLREIVDFEDESTNYLVARKLVREEGWPGEALDSEYSCFFGYTDTEDQANKLLAAAMRLAEGLKS